MMLATSTAITTPTNTNLLLIIVFPFLEQQLSFLSYFKDGQLVFFVKSFF